MADDECSERLRNRYRNGIERQKYQMANIEYHKQISKNRKRSEVDKVFCLEQTITVWLPFWHDLWDRNVGFGV